MDRIAEVARRRSAPGILMFDLEGRLCHVNGKAKELIPSLEEASIGSSPDQAGIPKEVIELCRVVKSSAADRKQVQTVVFSEPTLELTCAARAIMVGNPSDEEEATHLLVLLERVVENREADWERIRERYGLTDRETEVVRQVWEGLSNREIAGRLFISEHTVKDHLKNVMRKMGVLSRAEMIAVLR